MASKLQIITQLYNHQFGQITQSPAEWTAFLQAAAHNYKLPFDEQLLVYAQRPHATAVLGFDRWNEQFGRRINPGATGIAVFDRSAARPRLKYYFDINDTHETLFSQPVPLWEMQPELVPDVVEHLENIYDFEDSESLAAALLSAADTLATDNLPDYYEQLAEMGVGIDEASYFSALKSSVAYMLLSRCGVDMEGLSFEPLALFSAPAAVTSLGGATSAIAEMGLREIAAVVVPLQKNMFRTFDETPGASYNETIPAVVR